MTTLYIIRHGESQANINDVLSSEQMKTWGEFQSPLTEKGHKEAAELADRLKDIPCDALLSSDLTRAVETAQAIADVKNMQVKTISTIRERNYGVQFETSTIQQRQELKKALVALNEEEKFAYRYFEDSESAKDANDRFLNFLQEIIPLYEGKTVFVVNHGAIMRMFLVYIGWAKFDELPARSIVNTGYYVIETDGKTFEVKETYGVTKRI